MKLLLRILSLALISLTTLNASANALSNMGQIHAIGFGNQASNLYLATEKGLFLLDAEGNSQELTNSRQQLLNIATDPDNRNRLYTTRATSGDADLNLLVSDDRGRTFSPVNGDLSNQISLRKLTVSPADRQTIYGMGSELYRSNDRGKSWEASGQLPGKTFQIAASGNNTDHLYAATRAALLLSEDAGENWTTLIPLPTTSVKVYDGQLYAFVVGKGLMQADEQEMQWHKLSNVLGAQVLLDLAVFSQKQEQRIVGLTQYGKLMQSSDKGVTWSSLPEQQISLSNAETEGQKLYQQNCQSCHGIDAVGESYSEKALTSKDFFMAPALNGSMHTWHHTDQQLLRTIREGSPRTDKMPAWKQQLSDDQILTIIAYLKSMWGEPQKRCQGPKHMDRSCLSGS